MGDDTRRAGGSNVLDRHALRRRRGLPAISVLVGPPSEARDAFRAWVTEQGRALVEAVGVDHGVDRWLDAVQRDDAIRQRALTMAGAWWSRPPEAIEEWLPTVRPDEARHILQRRAPDVQLGRGVAALLVTELEEDPPRQRCYDIATLLGPGRGPALWLDASDPEAAAQLVLEVPMVAVGVSVRAAVSEGWEGRPGDGMALLRAGLVHLRARSLRLALDTPGLETARRSSAPAPRRSTLPPSLPDPAPDLAPITTAIRSGGRTPRDLLDAACRSVTTQSVDDLQRALDAGEWASEYAVEVLQQALEFHPWTHGRFARDVVLPLGGRGVDVSLYDQAAGLAVEISDFPDADEYRGERRVDLRLQLAGLVVVRLLAQDVARDLPDAVATVIAAVRHCASR
jgi:hypothetical protein